MKKHIFEDARAIAAFLVSVFDSRLKTQEILWLALSGGSTPREIFRTWAHEFRHHLDWKRLRFFWSDERCVPPTDAQSNFNMTHSALLEPLEINPDAVFRVRGEDAPESACAAYSQEIEARLPRQRGVPCFDIILLGMGADGHTASIFPHEIDLWDHSGCCVVATHPDTGQKRVSFTGHLINNAHEIYVVVTGREKQDMLASVASDPHASVPVARVDTAKAQWLLDTAAAGAISA